nr:hypothetical protein [Candidatus Sigynarchaeota archaeon]
MVFISSIENILSVAEKHPSLDVVALEKARNAARRILCDEIKEYRKVTESKPIEIQARPLSISQLKFHELG